MGSDQLGMQPANSETALWKLVGKGGAAWLKWSQQKQQQKQKAVVARAKKSRRG